MPIGLLPRQLPARSRGRLNDRPLGTLEYLGGWWYGHTALMGSAEVRIRLAGTLEGPDADARRVLCQLREQGARLCALLHPHLWADYLAREAAGMQAGEAIAGRYRLEAACAGAFGEHDLVELAIRADWAQAPIGLYLRGDRVVETRSNLRPWMWPA